MVSRQVPIARLILWKGIIRVPVQPTESSQKVKAILNAATDWRKAFSNGFEQQNFFLLNSNRYEKCTMKDFKPIMDSAFLYLMNDNHTQKETRKRNGNGNSYCISQAPRQADH